MTPIDPNITDSVDVSPNSNHKRGARGMRGLRALRTNDDARSMDDSPPELGGDLEPQPPSKSPISKKKRNAGHNVEGSLPNDADYEVGQIIANAVEEYSEGDDEMLDAFTFGMGEPEGLGEIDYLSEAKVREITGEPDAAQVRYFEAVVNTQVVSLGDLGHLCPQLEQLKLNNSTVECIRDLGTSLRVLRVLWINRSGLVSLDGLGSLSGTLEELYIAFNHIQDLSPITDDDFDSLRVLDCDSNEIEDMEQVEFLSGCKQLQSLTLDNNPVSTLPNYVQSVHEALPRLEMLDDLPFDTPLPMRPSTARAAELDLDELDGALDERDIVAESIKLSRLGFTDVEYMVGVNNKSVVPEGVVRPGTGTLDGMIRPSTALAGAGLLRRDSADLSSAVSRPGTGIARPGTPAASEMEAMRPGTAGARPGTASAHGSTGSNRVMSSSDLTFGSNTALCGNICSALRNRKRDVTSIEEAQSDSFGDVIAHEDILAAVGDRNPQPGEPEIWKSSPQGTQKEVNIMVITHDVASEGVVPECSPNSPNEGTPPVSPVVFDEAEQVGEEQEIMESWDD